MLKTDAFQLLYQKSYYQKHKNKILTKAKKYYKKNKAKINEKRKIERMKNNEQKS